MPDRIQREVEELLEKLDSFPPRRPWWSRARDSVAGFFGNLGRRLRLPSLSAGHVLLIGIALIVIGYVLLPGGSDMTRWLIAGGIVLFIGAFIFSLRRTSRPAEKYWRDKPMDLHGGSRSWWDRWRNRR
jgi:hypothetical protein